MMANYINWEVMLDQDQTSRCTGSHVGQLSNMFLDAQVIASECDDDYQGADCVVFLFAPPNPDIDPKIVIVNDYFGSCSGCDMWEDSDDESLRELLVAIANNARLFDSFDEAIKFLDEIIKKMDDNKPYGEYYDLQKHSRSLCKQLKEAEIKIANGQ